MEASREINGVISRQNRYYLIDLALSAADFNSAIRHHRGIKNQLHCYLDVLFHEDRQRILVGKGGGKLCYRMQVGSSTFASSQ